VIQKWGLTDALRGETLLGAGNVGEIAARGEADLVVPLITELISVTAPGNGAPIGGLKVVTLSGWFAARPSGTEDVYKLYAESFKGRDHLARIQEEAQAVIQKAFQAGGAHDEPRR